MSTKGKTKKRSVSFKKPKKVIKSSVKRTKSLVKSRSRKLKKPAVKLVSNVSRNSSKNRPVPRRAKVVSRNTPSKTGSGSFSSQMKVMSNAMSIYRGGGSFGAALSATDHVGRANSFVAAHAMIDPFDYGALENCRLSDGNAVPTHVLTGVTTFTPTITGGTSASDGKACFVFAGDNFSQLFHSQTLVGDVPNWSTGTAVSLLASPSAAEERYGRPTAIGVKIRLLAVSGDSENSVTLSAVPLPPHAPVNLPAVPGAHFPTDLSVAINDDQLSLGGAYWTFQRGQEVAFRGSSIGVNSELFADSYYLRDANDAAAGLSGFVVWLYGLRSTDRLEITAVMAEEFYEGVLSSSHAIANRPEIAPPNTRAHEVFQRATMLVSEQGADRVSSFPDVSGGARGTSMSMSYMSLPGLKYDDVGTQSIGSFFGSIARGIGSGFSWVWNKVAKPLADDLASAGKDVGRELIRRGRGAILGRFNPSSNFLVPPGARLVMPVQMATGTPIMKFSLAKTMLKMCPPGATLFDFDYLGPSPVFCEDKMITRLLQKPSSFHVDASFVNERTDFKAEETIFDQIQSTPQYFSKKFKSQHFTDSLVDDSKSESSIVDVHTPSIEEMTRSQLISRYAE
jgi:hypothetical protein